MNFERLSDLSGAHAARLQCAHLGHVYRSRAALVDTFGLSLGDAFELALATEVCFELGEHAKHAHEAFAGGRARIDRLFRSLKLSALGLDDAHEARWLGEG